MSSELTEIFTLSKILETEITVSSSRLAEAESSPGRSWEPPPKKKKLTHLFLRQLGGIQAGDTEEF